MTVSVKLAWKDETARPYMYSVMYSVAGGEFEHIQNIAADNSHVPNETQYEFTHRPDLEETSEVTYRIDGESELGFIVEGSPVTVTVPGLNELKPITSLTATVELT